ncbi:hypothetical protein RHGRI_038622 [Rhododendron griersonianum]|uniref:Uncharacterized protein n=1 Tax=Rhododendron griersonianum TaxID=479676 RepID=A0AAV6HM79_9ERIC|nr:hypothetical protein RHGRI_038622 [Rhododendron griersonianum]
MVLLHQSSESAPGKMKTSLLKRKLLVAGFVDVKVFPVYSVLQSEAAHFLGVRFLVSSSSSFCPTLSGWTHSVPCYIKARKIGASFALERKPTKVLPKVQIDDDMDLIDEDSLLTEEDLKTPQLPPSRN